jgi:hypothetical protein
MAAYFPEEVDLELARTIKPQGSFHPLGLRRQSGRLRPNQDGRAQLIFLI